MTSSRAFQQKPGVWSPTVDSKHTLWRSIRAHRQIYLLAVPVVALYIILCYMPIYGVTLAFKEFNFLKGPWGSPWVGGRIFQELFHLPEFWRAFNNTVILSLLKLICGFPVPIMVALFLNELRGKYLKKTIQTITFLPNLLSWAVLGVVFTAVFSQTQGYFNAIINMLGGQRIDFLHNSLWFRPTLICTAIWAGMGYGLVIYLAGLTTIEPELYEVAMLDGAGRFQRMIHISLPGLMPVIMTQLILSVGYIMYAGFEQVFVLYNPMVYDVGDIIETYVYRMGIQDANYSLATATGLFQAGIGMLLMLGVNLISKKAADRSIF